MPICVVSTVGSSVLGNASTAIRAKYDLFRKQETGANLRAICTAERDFPGYDIYLDVLAELGAKQETRSLRAASAELNSLSRILEDVKPNTNDSLVFLATETPDGVLAARILADFCAERFERDVEIELVEGLQVRDGQRLRQSGLRNLIRALYGALHGKHPSTYDRVFNPTGGFKAIVPYLTLIAMIEPEIRITYIFDQSDELISLARLPINLDYSRLEPLYPALKTAQSETLTESDLRDLLAAPRGSLIEHDAWSLFEASDIDGQTYFSLNGLGQIVVSHFDNRQRTPVYLSKQAADRLDRTPDGSEEKRNYLKIVKAIHDPQLRENNHHLYPNAANAPVYKLGRQAERAFYWDYGDYVLILEFARHSNETEYDTVPKALKQYDRFRQWEGDER